MFTKCHKRRRRSAPTGWTCCVGFGSCGCSGWAGISASNNRPKPRNWKSFLVRRRSTRRGRPGGSAADGPVTARLDRATGNPGAARAGAAQGQTGCDAVPMQGRGACRAGQGRGLGSDDRPVRGRRKPPVGQRGNAGTVQGTDRVAAPVHRSVRRRDRPVRWPEVG